MMNHRAPSPDLATVLRRATWRAVVLTIWAAAILMSVHVWGTIDGDRQPDSIVITTTQP